MPKHFELSGPAHVAFVVRDVEASADFFEKKLGFRRDPNTSGASVSFLSYPVPFAVLQAPPGVNLDAMPRPITAPSVWFKASNRKARPRFAGGRLS